MKTYDSYKDSGIEWIGKIPKQWKLIKYKNLGDRITTNIGVADFKNRDVIHYSIPNIQTFGTGVKECGSDIESSKLLLRGGELIISKLNPRKSCVSIVNPIGDELILGSGEFVVLKPTENLIKFLFYYVKNQRFTDFLNSSVESVTRSHQRVNPNIIYNSFTPIPPLCEQQQIVSFLDTKTSLIDSLIEKTQRKIELLREKRTSLINEAVTKGLNPDVEMKDSGVEWIGEIPSHYQMTSIKFLVTTPVSDGPHETPKFIDEGGIPFLSVEGVVGNKIDFEKVRGYISEELHQQYSKKCKPTRNDVLLVKSGSTTGKSTIVETDLEFNIWSPLCVIRSNTNKIIPRFTFQTFQSGYFRLLIENNWSYGTQPNIGMGVIENLRIVVPPKSEQTQIVEYLDHQTQKIDKSIAIEGARIDLLKEYRQSLISSVVTGKIKVTEDA